MSTTRIAQSGFLGVGPSRSELRIRNDEVVGSIPISSTNHSKNSGNKPALSAAPTALVTLVAVDAVVDISVDLLVVEVTRVVAAVAARALEYRVVAGINVAGSANAVGVAMVDRELGVLRVIEGRARPSRGVVAVLARGRKELRLRGVAWTGCVVVVRLMATDAREWQRRVVVVDMAVRANTRRHHVRTSDRESGVVVIERGVGPDDGVVAEFTGSRESGRRVRRIVRARVILLMA
jgi:hypothetical protein